MDCSGCCGRRTCCFHHFPVEPPPTPVANQNKSESIVKSVLNVFLLAVFIACLCNMIQFYSANCQNKHKLGDLNKNLEEIMTSLSAIDQNYRELHAQFSVISTQLPKLEGQIELLDDFVASVERKRERQLIYPPWDPVRNPCGVIPSNVDVTFNSRRCSTDNRYDRNSTAASLTVGRF